MKELVIRANKSRTSRKSKLYQSHLCQDRQLFRQGPLHQVLGQRIQVRDLPKELKDRLSGLDLQKQKISLLKIKHDLERLATNQINHEKEVNWYLNWRQLGKLTYRVLLYGRKHQF